MPPPIVIAVPTVATPAVTTSPPSVILTPFLAVTNPTESILVTSSYVNVPPTHTLPLKVASPVKVETPETEILSKFVCPSTSIS